MTEQLLNDFYEKIKESYLSNNTDINESFTDIFGNQVDINVKDWLDKEGDVKKWINENYDNPVLNTLAAMYGDNPAVYGEVIEGFVNNIRDNLLANRSRENSLAIQEELDKESPAKKDEEAIQHLMAWDPRLSRMETFYMSLSQAVNNGEPGAKIVVPFGSDTVATAFADMVYMLPAAVAQKTLEKNGKPADPKVDIAANSPQNRRDLVPVMGEDVIRQYETDGKFYGAASLMNPYSLTKLVGSFEAPTSADDNPQNFMYDIRDSRRFYSYTGTGTPDTITQVASPTVTHIIEWSNKDIWGRTPYSYQDFVYCKWFGIIPNNRLITLRRYHAPTRDNLQFEQMFGDDNGGTTSNDGGKKPTLFAPRCTVVSYIGSETGNTFQDFLKFSTGINWDEATADIWDVSGEDGSDPQAVIDEMFGSDGGFGGADNNAFNGLLSLGTNVTNRILSFGKMAMAINKKVDLTENAQMKLLAANMNPYENIYSHRIQGPLDRIQAVKRRKEGIIFDSSYQVTCTYVTKSIGGINPKAAMLDILANCMEMVSPTAIFWGGGHRFMITPHMYPFHDGGWRDNFMKRLYDGKIFGDDGAIATVLKGVKEFGTGDTGGFDWSNITSKLGGMLGTGLACISSLVSSVTTALFGEGTNALSAILDKGAQAVSGKNNDALKAAANNVFNNLNTMWHSKVLAKSVAPQIHGMNAILIGDPVGEWHLTVGNPLNPIIVVGNLICEKMDVQFGEELGPDDFPTELKVVYTLQHGMQRDKKAIQSMFNRGMGAIYELPDYIRSSSEFETHVDNFTGGSAFRNPGYMHTNEIKAKAGVSGSTYQSVKLDQGHESSNTGNYNTQLITKFNGAALSQANQTLSDINTRAFINNSNISTVRALGITRKFTT